MATYRNADQPGAMEYRSYSSVEYASITASGHVAGIYEAAANILALIASSTARGALSGAISGIFANLHANANFYSVLYHTVPGAIKGMHSGIFKAILPSVFGKEFSNEFKLGNMVESVFTNEFPTVALRADNKIVEHVLFSPTVDKAVHLLYQIKYYLNPEIRLAPPASADQADESSSNNHTPSDYQEKNCGHICTITRFSIFGAISMYGAKMINALPQESLFKILSSYMVRGALDHIYDRTINKLISSKIDKELDLRLFPAHGSEEHELFNPLTKSGANPNAVDTHGDDPLAGARVELLGQCDHSGIEASLGF